MTWLVAHVIKCYFLLIDTPIAFRYLSTYSHVQNPTYEKGDTHTYTNIMLVEITPYGLSCTYKTGAKKFCPKSGAPKFLSAKFFNKKNGAPDLVQNFSAPVLNVYR